MELSIYICGHKTTTEHFISTLSEIETIQAELLQRLTEVQDANKLLVVDYRVIDQKYRVKTDDEFETLKELVFEHNPATSRENIRPDWSAKRTEALADRYDDGWYYIERMENVETIRPRTLTH